jgi:hypothetical protein
MHSALWHFVVVIEREQLDGVAKIHASTRMSLQASPGFLVCGEPWKETLKEFFS